MTVKMSNFVAWLCRSTKKNSTTKRKCWWTYHCGVRSVLMFGSIRSVWERLITARHLAYVWAFSSVWP